MSMAISKVDDALAAVDRTLVEVDVDGAAATTRRRSGRRIRSRATVAFWQLVVFSAFLLVWETAHRREWGRRLVVRSPGQVWDAGWKMWDEDLIWGSLKSTLTACLLAMLLASLVGITLGLVLALLPRVERVFTPFLTALNSAPRIAFAPVFIIVFGIGTSAKVALAFSVVVFVLILNARAGVHAADADVVRLMEVMGATKRQIFRRLLLPVAVPSIFAGLRLGLIYSLLGVVTSEMIAAKDGMGQLVARYSANFELDKVYAIIFMLIVVATVLNTLMGVIERRLLWWQPRARER